jgi:hypothetical protein
MNDDDTIEPLVVRPRDAQRLLGCGNTKFYKILPELECYKEGSATLVTVRSIKERVARKLAEAQSLRCKHGA